MAPSDTIAPDSRYRKREDSVEWGTRMGDIGRERGVERGCGKLGKERRADRVEWPFPAAEEL